MSGIMVTVYDEFGSWYFKGDEDEFHSWATQYGQGRWDWDVVVVHPDDYKDVTETTVGKLYNELKERRKIKLTLDGKTREYRMKTPLYFEGGDMNKTKVMVNDEFGRLLFGGSEEEFFKWAADKLDRSEWTTMHIVQNGSNTFTVETTVEKLYSELAKKTNEKRTVVMSDTRVFNRFDEVIFEGTERGAYHWLKEAVSKRGNRDWDNSNCTVEVADRDKMTAREFLDMHDKKSDYARVLNDLDDIFFEGNEKDVFEKLETAGLYGDISNWKVETADRGVMAVKSFLALKRKQKKMQNTDVFRNREDQTMTDEADKIDATPNMFFVPDMYVLNDSMVVVYAASGEGAESKVCRYLLENPEEVEGGFVRFKDTGVIYEVKTYQAKKKAETESNFSLLNLIDLRRAAANFTAQIETVEESIRGQVTGDVTLKDKETVNQMIQDFQSGLDRYREKFFGEKTAEETDEVIRETIREEITKAFLDFNLAIVSKYNDLGESDKKASRTLTLLSDVLDRFRRTYNKNHR